MPDADAPELVASRQQLADAPSTRCGPASPRSPRRTDLNEIGGAIEDAIALARRSYGILEDYVGHGIGRSMHEEPPVFNYRVREPRPRGQARPRRRDRADGRARRHRYRTTDDDWTVATDDGADAAHWEHSVAVHADGIWVLTADDGGAAGLAPFGVSPVPIP